MNQENTADVLNYDANEKRKLPGGLNVLTILTFIWCVIQLFTVAWGFLTAQKTYEQLDQSLSKMYDTEMPAIVKSMMPSKEDYVQWVTKNYENRIPLFLLGLVAVALCFFGALQMRKLKKQGYLFYVIGELLPYLTMMLFIGAFSFSGTMFYLFLCIALLFIILYTLQRKHLVN